METSSQHSPSSLDSDELEEHFDDIDVDAVEFQPFMTNQSGIALNYHTSDHPEHKLLMQESILAEKEEQPPSLERLGLQALIHAISKLCLSPARASSPRSIQEKEERFPRRYVTFMGVVGFTAMIALCHIMNVTRFMRKSVWIAAGEASVQLKSRGNSAFLRAIQDAYRSIDDVPVTSNDTIVFWDASSTDETSDLLNSCLGLELVTGNGKGYDRDTSETMQPSKSHQTSTKGLKIVVLNDIWRTECRFNATHQGRLFSLFQTPVNRVLVEYKSSQQQQQQQQHQSSQHNKNSVATLEKYLSSVPDNLMVRSLANVHRQEPLTRAHLNTAKEIIQTRFVVGFLDHPIDSLQQFSKYFGWNRQDLLSSEKCKKKLSSLPRHVVAEASPEYQIVAEANRFDLELYEFIQEIFRQQETLIRPK